MGDTERTNCGRPYGLLYQDPKTLCHESTDQIYGMTNIGILQCLDQVHVYVDTGYFTITLRSAIIISSTVMISYQA